MCVPRRSRTFLFWSERWKRGNHWTDGQRSREWGIHSAQFSPFLYLSLSLSLARSPSILLSLSLSLTLQIDSIWRQNDMNTYQNHIYIVHEWTLANRHAAHMECASACQIRPVHELNTLTHNKCQNPKPPKHIQIRTERKLFGFDAQAHTHTQRISKCWAIHRTQHRTMWNFGCV